MIFSGFVIDSFNFNDTFRYYLSIIESDNVFVPDLCQIIIRPYHD